MKVILLLAVKLNSKVCKPKEMKESKPLLPDDVVVSSLLHFPSTQAVFLSFPTPPTLFPRHCSHQYSQNTPQTKPTPTPSSHLQPGRCKGWKPPVAVFHKIHVLSKIKVHILIQWHSTHTLQAGSFLSSYDKIIINAFVNRDWLHLFPF